MSPGSASSEQTQKRILQDVEIDHVYIYIPDEPPLVTSPLKKSRGLRGQETKCRRERVRELPSLGPTLYSCRATLST